MSSWTEADSATYSEISDVAVPRRLEMMRALIAAVPLGHDESFRIVELGCGDGRLAAALLERFPRATITALDGSESMRELASTTLAPFDQRARIRPFDVASLDWWDQMFGADLVVSSLCLHHVNDAKKQYLYKAVADRVSARGALLIADLIDPTHASVRHAAAERRLDHRQLVVVGEQRSARAGSVHESRAYGALSGDDHPAGRKTPELGTTARLAHATIDP